MQANKNVGNYLNQFKILRYYCKNVKSNKYTNTILLPRTNFPQKLQGKKLTDQYKNVYEKSAFNDFYSWQKAKKKHEFVLHDGPPYANGIPHMGHMINKILKDIINRFQIRKGYCAHYVPGFDCHGLPIELRATNEIKMDKFTPLDIRDKAYKFATKTIEEQSKVFKSWGVAGDWNNCYKTYSVPYIKNEFKQFYNLYEKNLVFRDFKPVYWSPSSRTALAEAELDYNENHKSMAVILKLKLSVVPQILKWHKQDIYALIWTTTPWTLPCNQAVCYNPELSYNLVEQKDNNEYYIIAADLTDQLSKTLNCNFCVVQTFTGKELSDAQYLHPFIKNDCPFLAGNHATAMKGTGLVHTAPAHGPEDFLVALQNKIPVECLVDESGKYTEDAGLFNGLKVLEEGNDQVIKVLNEDILIKEEYVHSYPYDWRTKKPVILRASQQWFINTNALKERAIKLVNDVKIVPEKNTDIYKQSLISQVEKRPYWCISRQRVWGVPMPVFYHKGKPLITRESINHLADLLEKHGPNFWWTLPTKDLISPDLSEKYNPGEIEKGADIFDIWFDSGISWSYALDNKVADLYLEGIDQFNGWFQSSLMTSVAIRDKAPYKAIFVHGFAVDQNGFKMSKSLNNVIDPQELVFGGKKQQPLGIDVLRWWVACHASQGRTSYVSPTVFEVSQNEVLKLRNTLKFAIGSIADYTYDKKDFSNLRTVDKYLLHLTYEFNKQVMAMFEEYQFNRVCITVVNFITNPVSALYYSIIKDRLYCNSQNDKDRHAAQYVLTVLLETICTSISPIVPHLVEEVYMYRTDREYETFYKSPKIKIEEEWHQKDIAECIDQVLNVKKYINKQYSNTLEVKCEIMASEDVYKKMKTLSNEELLELLQVAEVSIKEDLELYSGSYNLNLKKTGKVLCERCRKYSSEKEAELCTRCYNVIHFEDK